MEKMLITLPDDLVGRLRALVPPRQRSKTIAELIRRELARREKALYECARDVEQDEALNQEMQDWDITLEDGLNDESW